jgi:hypothetical protein
LLEKMGDHLVNDIVFPELCKVAMRVYDENLGSRVRQYTSRVKKKIKKTLKKSSRGGETLRVSFSSTSVGVVVLLCMGAELY